MTKLIISIILSTVLLISITQLYAEQNDTEYEAIDTEAFNDSIIAGKYQADSWLSDPVAVSLKFIGPFEGLNQKIIRKNESPEASDTTQVIIINEGLLDDSVQGVKYKISLKKSNNIWLLQSADKAHKCWPGRGHTKYSAELCK